MLESRLHDKGYNYFTIPRLTLPEIERLAVGAKREADIIELESKKKR